MVTDENVTTLKKEGSAKMVRRSTQEGDGADVKEALTINEDIEVTEYAPDVFSFLR